MNYWTILPAYFKGDKESVCVLAKFGNFIAVRVIIREIRLNYRIQLRILHGIHMQRF